MASGFPSSLDPTDPVLWEGEANYNRKRIIGGLIATAGTIVLLVLLEFVGGYNVAPLLLLAILLFVFDLSRILKYEGVRYRVTRRMIVIEQSLRSIKRKKEIPIDSLREFELKLRGNYLILHVATGERHALRLLRNDLDLVKRILTAARRGAD